MDKFGWIWMLIYLVMINQEVEYIVDSICQLVENY